MKYVSEADLRAYLINDGCDDGCGYLDERDIPSLPWIELDATDDDVLDKIRDEIERKAHSGQWSDATMYGMLKAVAIIDRYTKDGE